MNTKMRKKHNMLLIKSKPVSVFLTQLATVLLLFSCSQSVQTSLAEMKNSNSIIGGHDADSTFQKNNGVVGLLIISEKQSNPQVKPTQSQAICTGSLISKRQVVTAAHCLASPGIVAVLVVFETDIQAAVVRKTYVQAVNAVVNENYKPFEHKTIFTEGQPWNDIGLIVLESDAPADFSFAKLPTQLNVDGLSNQTQLTLAGFGVTNPIVNEVKSVQGRQVVVPVIRQAETAGKLRSVSGVPVIKATKDNNELLVDQQNGTRGACHGDSGGPAYLQNADGTYTLIGITSRGTDSNGNCDQQNVFTNIFGQLAWIKSKANLN